MYQEPASLDSWGVSKFWWASCKIKSEGFEHSSRGDAAGALGSQSIRRSIGLSRNIQQQLCPFPLWSVLMISGWPPATQTFDCLQQLQDLLNTWLHLVDKEHHSRNEQFKNNLVLTVNEVNQTSNEQTIWSPSFSGKHSGQLSIFPGVDVPASSPQGEKAQSYISDSTGLS